MQWYVLLRLHSLHVTGTWIQSQVLRYAQFFLITNGPPTSNSLIVFCQLCAAYQQFLLVVDIDTWSVFSLRTVPARTTGVQAWKFWADLFSQVLTHENSPITCFEKEVVLLKLLLSSSLSLFARTMLYLATFQQCHRSLSQCRRNNIACLESSTDCCFLLARPPF